LKLIKIKVFYWNEGTHYYEPLGDEFKTRKDFIKIAQNPMENMRIVGEMICLDQGWTQGALESVEKVITQTFIKID
jgi:monoamine oxidase